jgi:hypothetical protein
VKVSSLSGACASPLTIPALSHSDSGKPPALISSAHRSATVEYRFGLIADVRGAYDDATVFGDPAAPRPKPPNKLRDLSERATPNLIRWTIELENGVIDGAPVRLTRITFGGRPETIAVLVAASDATLLQGIETLCSIIGCPHCIAGQREHIERVPGLQEWLVGRFSYTRLSSNTLRVIERINSPLRHLALRLEHDLLKPRFPSRDDAVEALLQFRADNDIAPGVPVLGLTLTCDPAESGSTAA